MGPCHLPLVSETQWVWVVSYGEKCPNCPNLALNGWEPPELGGGGVGPTPTFFSSLDSIFKAFGALLVSKIPRGFLQGVWRGLWGDFINPRYRVRKTGVLHDFRPGLRH